MMERQIEALFCDDVRHEINGKTSYIGSYGTEMYVDSFPATLPKFCVAYWVRIMNSSPVASVTVKIMKEFDPIFEQEIHMPDPALDPAVQRAIAEGRQTGTTLTNVIVFTPFVIDEPCAIRVRAYTADGEELIAYALRVQLAPPATNLAE